MALSKGLVENGLEEAGAGRISMLLELGVLAKSAAKSGASQVLYEQAFPDASIMLIFLCGRRPVGLCCRHV